jgi:hypothetical protein
MGRSENRVTCDRIPTRILGVEAPEALDLCVRTDDRDTQLVGVRRGAPLPGLDELVSVERYPGEDPSDETLLRHALSPLSHRRRRQRHQRGLRRRERSARQTRAGRARLG